MIYIFIRDLKNLIPIEVKSNDNSTISLNKLIDSNKYKDIKFVLNYVIKILVLMVRYIHFHIF